MIKKAVCFLIAMLILLSGLSGCRAEEKEISCEDVVEAYEKAGYHVFHKEDSGEEEPWECYICVEDPDSEQDAYFHFFDSTQAAKDYAESRQWNVVLWLYSLVSFHPIWVTSRNYGNVAYEYEDSKTIAPFNTLIN